VRVFLDTNVLVSAFVARGLCADLVRYLLAEHELLTGELNLVELRRTLRGKLGASAEQVAGVEAQLRSQTVVPKPASRLALRVRDADDAWVLASAVAGEADLLVTGDRDLLAIADKAPLPILSPRDAWARLRESPEGI
jgi:putative PIN family toxin of toxin-antitoxin system